MKDYLLNFGFYLVRQLENNNESNELCMKYIETLQEILAKNRDLSKVWIKFTGWILSDVIKYAEDEEKRKNIQYVRDLYLTEFTKISLEVWVKYIGICINDSINSYTRSSHSACYAAHCASICAREAFAETDCEAVLMELVCIISAHSNASSAAYEEESIKKGNSAFSQASASLKSSLLQIKQMDKFLQLIKECK